MSDFSLQDDLALARVVAAQADLVSLPRFRAQDLVVSTKPDRTPVTDADRAVEEVIRATISASRPQDSLLGEEFGSTSAESGPQTGRQWIIDPIDGTAGFLRGLPIWATLIALAIDGTPVVGVVSAPALNQRWWAAKGLGAWTSRNKATPESIHVSAVGALGDATISYNSLAQWVEDGRGDQAMALSQAAWRSRAIGDFWPYMLVAEGQLDVAGEPDLQPYDMAALLPIVEEAGGSFSSLDGEPSIWHTTALVTNRLLHEEVLRVVAKK